MKKHNIHHDSSSITSSGQELSTSGYEPSTLWYALNVSSSPSHECLNDSRASCHMANEKAMFLALNGCNIKNIYVGDDRYISVVGCETIHLDNG